MQLHGNCGHFFGYCRNVHGEADSGRRESENRWLGYPLPAGSAASPAKKKLTPASPEWLSFASNNKKNILNKLTRPLRGRLRLSEMKWSNLFFSEMERTIFQVTILKKTNFFDTLRFHRLRMRNLVRLPFPWVSSAQRCCTAIHCYSQRRPELRLYERAPPHRLPPSSKRWTTECSFLIRLSPWCRSPFA